MNDQDIAKYAEEIRKLSPSKITGLPHPSPENPTWNRWPLKLGWMLTTCQTSYLSIPHWKLTAGREVKVVAWCEYRNELHVGLYMLTTTGYLYAIIPLHTLGQAIDWKKIDKDEDNA